MTTWRFWHRSLCFFSSSIVQKMDTKVYLPWESWAPFTAVWFTIGTIAIERFTFSPYIIAIPMDPKIANMSLHLNIMMNLIYIALFITITSINMKLFENEAFSSVLWWLSYNLHPGYIWRVNHYHWRKHSEHIFNTFFRIQRSM